MNTKLWYFQLFCSKIFQFPGIVTLWALLFFGSGSSGPSSANSNCGGNSPEKKVKYWPKWMDPRIQTNFAELWLLSTILYTLLHDSVRRLFFHLFVHS